MDQQSVHSCKFDISEWPGRLPGQHQRERGRGAARAASDGH